MIDLTKLDIADLRMCQKIINDELSARTAKKYKKLYLAFDAVIDNLDDSIDQNPKAWNYPDYRTIHINPGRRQGTTSYIASRFGENDIVFCRNERMLKDFVKLLSGENPLIYELRMYPPPLIQVQNRVFSVNLLVERPHLFRECMHKLRGLKIDKVWFDSCEHVSPETIRKMYNFIAPITSKNIKFIKMG